MGGKGAGLQDLHQVLPQRIGALRELPGHHGPGKIALQQAQGELVPLELLDDMVDEQEQVLDKIAGAPAAHRLVSLVQDPGADAQHQRLLELALVFKIEIKGTLGHLGALYNVVDGGFGDALFQKQVVGGGQKALLFTLFLLLQAARHKRLPLFDGWKGCRARSRFAAFFLNFSIGRRGRKSKDKSVICENDQKSVRKIMTIGHLTN